ncbi:MAG: sterol desaturase family protein [Rhodothermales bacterium]|nr:sterol desaturase family protein [Rhodothermales bacterium]
MPIDSNAQAIAAVVGLLVFSAWETFKPFFSFFKDRGRDRGKHFVLNLAIGAFNSVAITLVFVGLWALAANWAGQNNIGLINSFRGNVPAAVTFVVAILGFDLWTYSWHRINHVVGFFWRFHRVHHSDNKMDVSTASRFHIGEIVLSSLLRVPVIVILGATLWELVLYETLMFAVVQFHHANIVIPDRLDRFLRVFIVTPAMHKVHHSRVQPETDSNFSAFLSIWDRIGRSFRMRKDLDEIHFGLVGYDDPESQSIAGIAKTPIRKLDS